MSSRRRKSREAALKALYQHDLIGEPAEEALARIVAAEFLQPAFQTFIREFIQSADTAISLPAGEIESYVEDFACRFLVSPRPEYAAVVKIIVDEFDRIFPEASDTSAFTVKIEELARRIVSKIESNASMEDFASQLTARTMKNISQIDSILGKFADNWALDRMASLDRSILRFATCELLFFPDIPVNVTINEAIELAKRYSTERSCEFVNGILDKIQRELTLEKDDKCRKGKTESGSPGVDYALPEAPEG